MKFYISDLHFGHKNIIKYDINYTPRTLAKIKEALGW